MSRIQIIILAYFLLIVSFFFTGKPFGFFLNGASLGLFLFDLIKHVRRRDEEK